MKREHLGHRNWGKIENEGSMCWLNLYTSLLWETHGFEFHIVKDIQHAVGRNQKVQRQPASIDHRLR